MELKRKIEEKFKEWKKTSYALFVYGARQVGKTHIIDRFLKQEYGDYFYLNFHENINSIKTLIKAENIHDFYLRLSLLDSKKDIETCEAIFLDEIQEYYSFLEKHPEIDTYFDIISETKYMSLDGRHRIILSGSLLRLEMNNLITNPVGYLYPIEMHPLDFEEFILANGVNKDIISIVKNCYESLKEVPEYIHNKLMYLFRKYILIGGMPKAVSSFLETNSFSSVNMSHITIDHFIREDIVKYAADNEKLKIQEIYDLIPSELSRLSRKFIISDIPGHKKDHSEQLSFSWLDKAGVTTSIYIVSEPKFPLKISSSRNQFKLFHLDVGILTYMLFDYDSKEKILNNDISINMGPLYENAVAQQLKCHGFNELYYYNNKKLGEVDFLVQKGTDIIPIEVKSGKNYKYHCALNNIMNISEYDFKNALVLYNGNVKVSGKIIYIPIYMSTFIKKKL